VVCLYFLPFMLIPRQSAMLCIKTLVSNPITWIFQMEESFSMERKVENKYMVVRRFFSVKVLQVMFKILCMNVWCAKIIRKR